MEARKVEVRVRSLAYGFLNTQGLISFLSSEARKAMEHT
jgi:hypothetical protein